MIYLQRYSILDLTVRVAFISSVFSFGLNIGFAIASNALKIQLFELTGISFAHDHGGSNNYESVIYYCATISVSLFILIVLRIRNKIWHGVPFLLLILLPATFVVLNKPLQMPKWIASYSSLYSYLWYLDFGILLLSVSISFLYIKILCDRKEDILE